MLSGPYGFDEDRLAPLVGLRGPDVSINVSRAEITIMYAMVGGLGLGEASFHATTLVRELDIRHGAAASMRPEADTIEITVPMGSAEVTIVREVWATLTNHGRHQCRIDGATDLVRDLDRRLGAAQAAAAERAAGDAFETLGAPVAGARPTVVYVDAPLPSNPRRLDHNMTPPRLRKAILAADVTAGGAGLALGTLFWVLIIRSWDTDAVLAAWIVGLVLLFGGSYFVASRLTRHARRLAAEELSRTAPSSPINAAGLPVEMWDESEFTR